MDSFETDVWLSGDKVLVLVHGGFMGDISGYYNAHFKETNANWDKLSKIRTRRGNFSMPRVDEIMQLTKNKIHYFIIITFIFIVIEIYVIIYI